MVTIENLVVSKKSGDHQSNKLVACSLRSPPDFFEHAQKYTAVQKRMWTPSTSQIDWWYISDTLNENNDKKNNENNKLVIIPGIKGKMGETYCNAFQNMPGVKIIGLTRQKIDNENECLKNLDLFDVNYCQQFVKDIELTNINEIYLIHAIGPFLFEENGQPIIDKNKDGIDDNVYKSNVETFYNISKPLIKRIREESNQKKTNQEESNKKESKKHPIKLTLCAFGSISDRYSIPLWQSYSKSKNILREFIRSNVDENVRGVFINVSSTEKEEERKFADKTYWLSYQEVVNRSMRAILDAGLYWQEIDIFKPNPDYKSDYYFKHDKLRTKWLKEMKGE